MNVATTKYICIGIVIAFAVSLLLAVRAGAVEPIQSPSECSPYISVPGQATVCDANGTNCQLWYSGHALSIPGCEGCQFDFTWTTICVDSVGTPTQLQTNCNDFLSCGSAVQCPMRCPATGGPWVSATFTCDYCP